MSSEKSVPYEKWVSMRKKTTVIFTIQMILLGMDYFVTFLTLWMYIKELVNTKHPLIYFGVVSVSYVLSSTIFPTMIGCFVDRTRKVRLAFYCCNTLAILGNLLYIQNFSPWFLVAGRFLVGLGSCLRSVICGEICRSYPPKDLSVMFGCMGAGYAFGILIVSSVNGLFMDVDIRVQKWRLTYLNISGVYMAGLYVIVQIMSTFMLFDLSAIYDLKKATVEMEAEKQSLISDDEKDKPKEIDVEGSFTFCGVIVDLFTKFDTCVIILLSFFGNYLGIVYDAWLAMLIVGRLHWPVTALDEITIGLGFSCVIMCVLLIFIKVTDNQIYYLLIVWLVSQAVVQMIIAEQYYFKRNKAIDISVWVLFCVLHGLFTVAEEVALVGSLSKMVSSSIQTFSDGVRFTMYRLGSLVAFAISAFVFPYMYIISIVHICVIVVLILLLIVGRRSFMSPRIVVYR